MIHINISLTEIKYQQLNQSNLQKAVTAIVDEGFVILNNLIPHHLLDSLTEKMDHDADTLIALKRWGGRGAIEGHLQLPPPPFQPYVFKAIVNNTLINQVTHELLGANVFNSFYNGNTNCPGSKRQALHIDEEHLWSYTNVIHPAASLVINIPLGDVSEENGSTELWPCSHLTPQSIALNRYDDIKGVEQQRVLHPPIRANIQKGSVIIRDPRLWHRGMPNVTNKPRHVLAMLHNAHWRKRTLITTFSLECQELFEDTTLFPNYRFAHDVSDYLDNIARRP